MSRWEQFLEKLRLTDDDEDLFEGDDDITDWDIPEWEESRRDERDKLFFKRLSEISDAKLVLEEYKNGYNCIVMFDLLADDPQGIMNYLAGGVYALEGNLRNAGGNIYAILTEGASLTTGGNAELM